MTSEVATITEYDQASIRDVASEIQRSLSRWFPSATHPGGFAWEVATEQLPPRLAVARSSTAVQGWAAYSEEDARVECAPDDIATTELLVEWLLAQASTAAVSVAVHRRQRHLHRLLTDVGFEEAHAIPGLSHPAAEVTARIPGGYAIRPMAAGEETERVDAHRKAWKPAHLPFTDDESQSSIDPDAESRFDQQKFAAMRELWLYDRDLDLVIEAPDGSLAGCCTVWLDASSGWAEIEPLGIVPEHRRRGLAQILALEVCRRVAQRGGRQVFINSAPLPYYRAPWDTYLKAGFVPMARGVRMSRRGA